jgi:hypothetical protein
MRPGRRSIVVRWTYAIDSIEVLMEARVVVDEFADETAR